MQRGDLALFYHSSAKKTGVAGTVQIVRAAYPDATAFDPKDAHYDATADRSNPVWYTVDVRLERKFKRIVTLDELKRQRALSGMRLLQRGNRLSVLPIEAEHWELILGLE